MDPTTSTFICSASEDSAVCSGAAAPAVGALALAQNMIDSINSDAEDDIVVRRLLDAWMTRQGQSVGSGGNSHIKGQPRVTCPFN